MIKFDFPRKPKNFRGEIFTELHPLFTPALPNIPTKNIHSYLKVQKFHRRRHGNPRILALRSSLARRKRHLAPPSRRALSNQAVRFGGVQLLNARPLFVQPSRCFRDVALSLFDLYELHCPNICPGSQTVMSAHVVVVPPPSPKLRRTLSPAPE